MLEGGILYIVRYLAPSLDSTHQMTVALFSIKIWINASRCCQLFPVGKIICFENQYLNMLIIVVSNSFYDNSNSYMVYEFVSHDFFVSSYCVFLCFCVLQYFWLKDDHAYRVIYRDITFYTQILACFSFYQAFTVGVCVNLVRNWTRFEICLVAIVAMVTRVRICCYGYQSQNLLLPWAPEISKSSSDTLFLFLHLALDLSSVLLPPESLSCHSSRCTTLYLFKVCQPGWGEGQKLGIP